MRTVHKYRLERGLNQVEMPTGAEVVCVGTDGRHFTCIWVHIPETDAPTTVRSYLVVATGEALPMAYLPYVGTAFSAGHVYVWHVYEQPA